MSELSDIERARAKARPVDQSNIRIVWGTDEDGREGIGVIVTSSDGTESSFAVYDPDIAATTGATLIDFAEKMRR